MNVFIDPCSSVVKSPQTSASVETEDGSGLPGLGGAGTMVRAKCHDCCQRMVEWSLPPVRRWATGGASYVHSKKGRKGSVPWTGSWGAFQLVKRQSGKVWMVTEFELQFVLCLLHNYSLFIITKHTNNDVD